MNWLPFLESGVYATIHLTAGLERQAGIAEFGLLEIQSSVGFNGISAALSAALSLRKSSKTSIATPKLMVLSRVHHGISFYAEACESRDRTGEVCSRKAPLAALTITVRFLRQGSDCQAVDIPACRPFWSRHVSNRREVISMVASTSTGTP